MAEDKQMGSGLTGEDELKVPQQLSKAETRILIADDYEFMRQTISGILRQIGYQKISEAADGNAAVTFLENNAVDLILCDWEMPGKSGMEVLRFVLNHKKLKQTPFIMITARSALSELERAVENGVQHFIVKPFSPDILRKKIAAVLGKPHDRDSIT